MNYRVNVFGFLGGKEVRKSGESNLGLWDRKSSYLTALAQNADLQV